MDTVVQFRIKAPFVEEMLAKFKNILSEAGDKVEMIVESEPFDPTIKLTYEELFALPEDQRMQYYDANGGVVAVAEETGYALSDESADAIIEYLSKTKGRRNYSGTLLDFGVYPQK
jgi:hypothetical protein